MPYTMADFERDYFKKYFPRLTREEREEVFRTAPAEERLAGLSADKIRRYLDQMTAGRGAKSRKPRPKK